MDRYKFSGIGRVPIPWSFMEPRHLKSEGYSQNGFSSEIDGDLAMQGISTVCCMYSTLCTHWGLSTLSENR